MLAMFRKHGCTDALTGKKHNLISGGCTKTTFVLIAPTRNILTYLLTYKNAKLRELFGLEAVNLVTTRIKN